MAVTRNYFQKFPSISYSDYVIRDISVRTKLSQYLQETGVALLPYTVKEGERADSIASFYYDDPYYAWAIYLVNGIIDPYSEWPKTQQTFNQYIDDTYGSAEAARDVIVHYEVNWASDTTMKTPEQYEALTAPEKKYWEAMFGYNNEIISYFRTQLDWTADNNRLDQITVIANASVNSLASSFEVGERLYQYNYLNDVAVKSTIISVDTTVDSNTVLFGYTNSTFNDVTFSSGNTTITLKSTAKLVPRARFSGTNIPANTQIDRIVDGTRVELSAAPTGSPASNSTYTFANPAYAELTVQKVDFSDVIFASTSEREAPNSFFTYTRLLTNVSGSFTSGNSAVSVADTSLFSNGQLIRVMKDDEDFSTAVISTNSTHLVMNTSSTFTGTGTIYYGDYLYYNDDENYLVGRKNGANVTVITHDRLDTNAEVADILSDSRFTNEELKYWSPVNAYDNEIELNERRKEIYVLDVNFIGTLDDNLEALTKNV
jgi:hypothetical protein